MKRGRTTLTEIKWADIHSLALQGAQPPRVALTIHPIFPNKQAHKCISTEISFNLNLIHWTNLTLMVFLSTLHGATPPGWGPLVPWWDCYSRSCNTIGSPFFRLRIVLILANLVIALEGNIFKMETRAMQIRLLTATPGLGRPTNGTGAHTSANSISPPCRNEFTHLLIHHSCCWINWTHTSQQRPNRVW